MFNSSTGEQAAQCIYHLLSFQQFYWCSSSTEQKRLFK